MRRAAAFILFVLFIPNAAWACTMIYPTYTVGTTFTVKVVFPAKSARGIRLELTSPSRKLVGVTGEDGYATFKGIEPGLYELATTQRGLNDLAYVVVAESPTKAERVVLRYPTSEVLSSPVLSGRLLYRHQKPLLLTVVKQPEGRVIGSGATDKDGRFHLSGVDAGSLYTLEVADDSLSADEKILGAIPILISKGNQTPLDLSLSVTTCGLRYAGDCSAGQVVKAPSACFSVVDSMGAIIPDTRIRLTSIADPSQQFALTTDQTGEAKLAQNLTGEYRARLDGSGFPPVERLVQFEGKACTKVVKVELGLSGCTGKMSLEKVHAPTH